MAIRVLIVDDHSVVREGLRMFLTRDPDLEIVGEAADGARAIELARQQRPDVVVMDLPLPVVDGMTAIRAIRNELPETQVLAITGMLEQTSVVEAIEAGPLGTSRRILTQQNCVQPLKQPPGSSCTSLPRPRNIAWVLCARQSAPIP